MAAGHARICRDCAWEIATGGDEPMVGHRLELVREPGGWRHYLAGEPIACGTSLELYVGQGCWMTGRYECDLGAERPRPMLVLYGPNDRYSERRNGFANEVLENDCPSIAVFGDLHLREEVRLRRPRRQN